LAKAAVYIANGQQAALIVGHERLFHVLKSTLFYHAVKCRSEAFAFVAHGMLLMYQNAQSCSG